MFSSVLYVLGFYELIVFQQTPGPDEPEVLTRDFKPFFFLFALLVVQQIFIKPYDIKYIKFRYHMSEFSPHSI